MYGSLSESFGNNSGLGPLHAKHELDDRVQEAGKHALQHIFGARVATKEEFVEDGFVGRELPRQYIGTGGGTFNFPLEEQEEVGVARAVAEVLGGCGCPICRESVGDTGVDLLGWKLVGVILVVAGLDG